MKNTPANHDHDTSGDPLLHGVGLLSNISPKDVRRIKVNALREGYRARMRAIVRG